MELINQHTKQIMEGCKERAQAQGLRFGDETLEYIVTNKDLLDLSPKLMIPTLYDYWVHDVEALVERGKYELYPHNPYETVINTRPAISFYNDNNPDWLNVMIFYHVLAHIDFFHNNMLYKHTWDEDFAGQALSDKRLITRLRSEKGRWVDYVIEFSRGIDNLVNMYAELSDLNHPDEIKSSKKIDFYFDIFLQSMKSFTMTEYLKEIDRFNDITDQYGDMAESVFFSSVAKKYPEFEALFDKYKKRRNRDARDIMQYIQDHSTFLQKEENKWMKSVMQIIRNTALYFQPQIRTKILNEGWASYWHEKLFMLDDRINGNEVSFARVNAMVTALPRVGINPYALGMRLFSYIEKLGDKGRLSYDFQKMKDAEQRTQYDRHVNDGVAAVFNVRENFSDFNFINTFVDQDFVNEYNLFVTGKRMNATKGVWEYYVKTRDARAYKHMLFDSLYHPPHIKVDEDKMKDQCLYLTHQFEGKPLVSEYIANTMLGIEYLWGGTVKLETTELVAVTTRTTTDDIYAALYSFEAMEREEQKLEYRRILYTMENRQLSREVLE